MLINRFSLKGLNESYELSNADIDYIKREIACAIADKCMGDPDDDDYDDLGPFLAYNLYDDEIKIDKLGLVAVIWNGEVKIRMNKYQGNHWTPGYYRPNGDVSVKINEIHFWDTDDNEVKADINIRELERMAEDEVRRTQR